MSSAEEYKTNIDKYILNLELFRVTILSYNLEQKNDKLYSNLDTLRKELNKIVFTSVKTKLDKNFFRREENKNNATYKMVKVLETFEPFSNKEVLYQEKIVNVLQDIFEKILYTTAFRITNIGDFIDYIVSLFNHITIVDYFKIDCSRLDRKPSADDGEITNYDYNCGRAMMQVSEGPTKFLIFNTNNDAMPDLFILTKYSQEQYFDIVITDDSSSDDIIIFKNELLKIKNIGSQEIDNLFKFFNNIKKNLYKKNVEMKYKLKIPILTIEKVIVVDMKLSSKGKDTNISYFIKEKDNNAYYYKNGKEENTLPSLYINNAIKEM